LATLSFRIFWNISMLLTDLVAPNGVIPALKVNSKKQILQSSPPRRRSFRPERAYGAGDPAAARARSTGVGNGMPFATASCPSSQAFGLFARLDRPVDFEALDGQPVDLVFLLACAGDRPAPIISRPGGRVARLPARCRNVARKLRDSRDAESPLRLCWRCRRRARPDRGGEKSKPVGNSAVRLARCESMQADGSI